MSRIKDALIESVEALRAKLQPVSFEWDGGNVVVADGITYEATITNAGIIWR